MPASLLCRTGLVALTVLTSSPALAGWQPGGTPLGTQISYGPNTVADGVGGLWIAHDEFGRPHLSHRDEGGELPPGWNADITVSSGPPFLPPHGNASHVVADAEGGAYVVSARWHCTVSCHADGSGPLYVQRIDSQGAVAKGWTSEGVPLGNPASGWTPDLKQPGNLEVAQDGAGGLLVVWRQTLVWGSSFPVALRAQRITPDGRTLWGDGIDIVASSPSLHDAALVPDGRGGASIFWVDERDPLAPRVYRQDLDSSGRPRWDAGGISISTLRYHEVSGLIAVGDGTRGAFVVWKGRFDDVVEIFAMRATAGRGVAGGGERRIGTGEESVEELDAAATPGGGWIVTWTEHRSSDDLIVRAQKVGRSGRVAWGDAGVELCAVAGRRYHVRVADDGRDGAYVAWVDSRPGAEVMASHLDGLGSLVKGWLPDGTPVSDQVAVDGPFIRVAVPILDLVHDGVGNAFLVWQRDDAIPEHIVMMKLLPGGPAAPVQSLILVSAPHSAGPVAAVPVTTLRIRPMMEARHASMMMSLPEAGAARVDLLDVMGRRVWSRDLSSLGVGEHKVQLDGIAALPAGVYLARLTQGERIAVARVAIVR